MELNTDPSDRERRLGLMYGLAAYFTWGFTTIYWKLLDHVPAIEVVAHRIVWGVVLAFLIVAVTRQLPVAWAVLRDRRRLGMLVVTAALIAMNWFTIVWAVSSERILEASLGYFVNPLVSVGLAVLFLGERPRRWQAVAIAIAAIGVANLALRAEEFPWAALTLAFSFGFYGLFRKTMRVDALVGQFVELALLAPLAALFLLVLAGQGRSESMDTDTLTWLLLVGSSLPGVVPLIWFSAGVRRMSYSAMSVLQYISPSLNFLFAIFLFGEAFTTPRAIAFACIWTALAIYTADVLLDRRRMARTTVAPPPGSTA